MNPFLILGLIGIFVAGLLSNDDAESVKEELAKARQERDDAVSKYGARSEEAEAARAQVAELNEKLRAINAGSSARTGEGNGIDKPDAGSSAARESGGGEAGAGNP